MGDAERGQPYSGACPTGPAHTVVIRFRGILEDERL